MVHPLFVFLTFLLNTPLPYLICLLIVVGYMYVVTRREVRRILHGQQQPPMQGRQAHGFAQVRMAARHSEAVICQSCGKLVNHVAVRHQTKAGQVMLCQGCAKHYGRAQRAARIV